MYIELELEGGLLVDIDLDNWMPKNYSDQTNISWCLQNKPDQEYVDGLLKRHIEGGPIFTDPDSILRLFN